MRRSTWRPSNGPKLHECGWFASSPMQDRTYLNRGQGMDTAYRSGLSGTMPVAWGLESQDEIDKVSWAVKETLELAYGSPIFHSKDDCKVWIEGFHYPGEVDAKCPGKLFSVDVKSGQEYDYLYQQVHYARGQMEQYFADTWTVWMLYLDLRKKVKYSFTLEEAIRICDEERERFYNPGEPRINQYCSWCDNFTECPAQRLLVDRAMGHLNPEFNFEELKKDPVKLGKFLTEVAPLARDGGFYERGRKAAKELIFAKTAVPGWGLQSRQGNKYVNQEDLPDPIWDRIDWGSISYEKYLEACKKAGVEPDQSIIKQGAGSTYLVEKKVKE